MNPLLAAYAVVALVHLVAQALDASTVASTTQVLVMPLLAAHLLSTGVRGRLTTLTLVALGFSWLGDTLPRFLEGDPAFLAMIGAFLVAQVAYVVAFWPFRGRSVIRRPLLVAPYAAVVAALVVWCAPGADGLLPAVLVYGAVLGAMAVLATGVNTWTAVGGALFLVSDGLIALHAFAPGFDLPGAVQDVAVMSTYLLAQVLLVVGVIRAERADRPGTLASSAGGSRSAPA